MVPRVAGPSPRLGRVLGPLGRRAEALGSSDTAAAAQQREQHEHGGCLRGVSSVVSDLWYLGSYPLESWRKKSAGVHACLPMGVWVGSARRWLASGMGVCPRRQEGAST